MTSAPGSAATLSDDSYDLSPRSRPTFAQTWPIVLIIAIAAIALFAAAALRHYFFRSGAMDLAFFDQLAWLISRGDTPTSSILGIHLLGDHAAYNLYLVAPFYWIWSNVHIMLLVQAIALAIGAYPVWRLSRLRRLDQRTSLALAMVYLLYPIVLTANLSDFHPEAISVAALLFAVLAVQQNRLAYFILALIVALGGKEIIGLTVAMFGVWLLIFEKRLSFGLIAIVMGVGWFTLATRWVIPHFGAGREASGVKFFAYLGSNVPEIVQNLFLHPGMWLKVVFSLATLKYLCVLFLPVIWGLVPRRMAPLIVALPTLALNILASTSIVNLKNPFTQYSVIVVPFLTLAIMNAVAHRDAWLIKPRAILAWSIGLVVLGAGARVMFMKSHQTVNFDNQRATRAAIAMINADGGVLTTHETAPHLSERPMIQFIDVICHIAPIGDFDYVLINLAHDSTHSTPENQQLTQTLLQRAREVPVFKLVFHDGDVYLFQKN